jgi:DnaJ like chaperone protein
MLQRLRRRVKKRMAWYGKLFGAILGAYITHSWVGALVGLFIGHQFDRRFAAPRAPRASAVELSAAFFRATFQAMGHVAKSDGLVTAREIDAAREAMRRFSLTEAQVRMAIELYTDGKRPDFPLEDTIRNFGALARGRPDLCRMFVQIQIEAALRGGGIGPAPRAVLERISTLLGVSALEFASLEAMLRMRGFGPGTGPGAQRTESAERVQAAYQVLGVPPTASNAEVTRAYRRQMSRNHPDKLVANGLPESMVAAAHERTQRILEAYELIKQQRGMR